MKCPKCGYLGFKHVERCPNCGYDFSLSSSPNVLDLAIRFSPPDTPQPLADLAMVDSALAPTAASRPAVRTTDLPRVRVAAAAQPTPDLPLFGSPIVDDVPLITRPSPPRTPLAVRRATPEVPRLRSESRAPMLDLAAPEIETRPSASRSRPLRTSILGPDRHAEAPPAEEAAAVGARVVAAAIDLVVLAAIDIAVVYFTMQICGVALGELSILPKVPLLAFLICQNVAYFVAFTAGGQTMGQMALRIKVVSDDVGASPDLTHAVLRTLVWAVLAVPAGLGLVTALFSEDRRGLHDRCAGTRVVRASA